MPLADVMPESAIEPPASEIEPRTAETQAKVQKNAGCSDRRTVHR